MLIDCAGRGEVSELRVPMLASWMQHMLQVRLAEFVLGWGLSEVHAVAVYKPS